ncbi:MAG: leucine-rich repeat domain-containing protein [Candidatus Hermodarchaeota archaeon]
MKLKKETILKRLNEGTVQDVIQIVDRGYLDSFRNEELLNILNKLDFIDFSRQSRSGTRSLLVKLNKFNLSFVNKMIEDEMIKAICNLKSYESLKEELNFLVDCFNANIPQSQSFLYTGLHSGWELTKDSKNDSFYLEYLNDLASKNVLPAQGILDLDQFAKIDPSQFSELGLKEMDGIVLLERDFKILKQLAEMTGVTPEHADYLDDYMTIGYNSWMGKVVDLVINNFGSEFMPETPIQDLNDIAFNRFPEEIYGLVDLGRLGILGFQSINLNGIENLSSLDCLIIQECSNVELPESLNMLKDLEELEISYSNLKIIPKIIGMFSSLKKLDLRGNQIKEIPDFLKNLKNLKKLNLCGNPIKKYPPWFDELDLDD